MNDFDQGKVMQFAGKVLGDVAGTSATILAAIGEACGLWRHLAGGPATSEVLAARSGLHERYVREWLGGMTAAGYVSYEPDGATFSLPAEHAEVFAREGGPFYFGGAYEMLLGLMDVAGRLPRAFRDGGGVPQSAYPESTYRGMERFTSGIVENVLLQEWVPAVPGLQPALERGIDVADVGCGRGRAMVKLAGAFPASRFVGYDIHEPNVAAARRLADDAGVSGRVEFVAADVAGGLGRDVDLVWTFDVVHDAADPLGLLRAIRAALRPGGRYICMDVRCSERLEDNVGPLATFFYGSSVLYCMTTSLAAGGAGLGTLGLHEGKLRELGTEAGFASVERLPIENLFNNLYELRP